MTPLVAKQDALEMLLSRVERLLDDEVRGLAEFERFDHSAFFAGKSMLAFEIETFLRANPTVLRSEPLYERIARLRNKLDESKRVLDIQIRACRQIVRILSEVQRSGESDGTYCIRAISHGRDR